MREGSSKCRKEKTGVRFSTQALAGPPLRTLQSCASRDDGVSRDSVASLEHDLQRQLDLRELVAVVVICPAVPSG